MGTRKMISFIKFLTSSVVLTLSLPVAMAGSFGTAVSSARDASTRLHGGVTGASDHLAPRVQLANVFSAQGGDPRNPPQDPREYVQRTGIYAPIGSLELVIPAIDRTRNNTGRDIHTRSTAFLISPCYIQTTYHSVFASSQNPRGDWPGVTFSAGQGAGNEFKHANVEAEPVVWGAGRLKGGDSADWAILKLKACVGRDPEIGWMLRGRGELGNNSNIAGLSIDRGLSEHRISVQKNCSLREMNGGVWRHDCAGRPGASGSPIFTFSAQGVPRVLAMHFSGSPGGNEIGDRILPQTTHENLNSAIDQASIYNRDVSRLVDEDILAFGREFGKTDLRAALELNPQVALARQRTVTREP